MIQVITTNAQLSQAEETMYEFLLAVSHDTLVVLTMDRELVQSIVWGVDHNADVVAADNLDAFLDAITMFKEMIEMGLSPKNWLCTSSQQQWISQFINNY